MIRNSVFCTCLFLISSAASGIVYEDENSKFSPVGAPDEVFSGMYVGLGLELISNECKYEILTHNELCNTIQNNHRGSIRTYPYSFLGIIGFGGVYNRFYYAGVETELFFRRGGGTKESNDIRIQTKNTYGFNFRLRGGYIFKQHGLMLYGTVSADRSINNIAAKKQNPEGEYTGYESFGSYHPSIGIGLEKKLRDNWGIRGEFVYTIGIWDDTGKFLKTADNSTIANSPRFRATANKKSIKLSVVKYL